jgi:hypothetical protein
MNRIEFHEIIKNRISQIKHVMLRKNDEYATSDDALHNFNRGSAITGQSRERVLKGFMLKHEISIMDMIDDIDKGILPSEGIVDEKIGDVINYYILLEACIKEKIKS